MTNSFPTAAAAKHGSTSRAKTRSHAGCAGMRYAAARTQAQRRARQEVLEKCRDDADLPGTVQVTIDRHFRAVIERATNGLLTVVGGRIVRAA